MNFSLICHLIFDAGLDFTTQVNSDCSPLMPIVVLFRGLDITGGTGIKFKKRN